LTVTGEAHAPPVKKLLHQCSKLTPPKIVFNVRRYLFEFLNITLLFTANTQTTILICSTYCYRSDLAII